MERLREKLDLRLTLTIAAGIFGGLTLYRLFMWSHEWWADLSSERKTDLLSVALVAIIGGATHYGLRRVITRLNQSTPRTAKDVAYWQWSRRKHLIRSAMCTVFLFSMFLTASKEAWLQFWIVMSAGVLWILFRVRARLRILSQRRAEQHAMEAN